LSLAACAVPLLLAAHGLRTKKLTLGGACMSVAVGWLLMAAGLKYFITVITFYILGSAATKFRSGTKMGMVSEVGSGMSYGQRGAKRIAIKGGIRVSVRRPASC
jgi:uncharacterized membrane protein